MLKVLARSVREFKRLSILTPILVLGEVVMECIIPFTIANLVNEMQAGCGMDVILRYGMQLIWIGVSAFIAISILLIDDKYYHILAYPLYWFSILVLIGVLLFGKEVNGAKSWLFGIQPSEFVKFTTALALARYMSSYSFDIRNLKHLLHVAILLGLPVLIVMLQNDTGSALVFGSFLFMLYREGFNGWVYIALIMIISLFIFSFLLEPTALLIVLILVCVVGEGMTNGNWRSKAIYLAGLALGSTLIYTVCQLLLSRGTSPF